MSAEVFADMLLEVDLTDPDQQSVAVSIASKMVARPESDPSEGDPSGEEEEEGEEESAGRSSNYLKCLVFCVIFESMRVIFFHLYSINIIIFTYYMQ